MSDEVMPADDWAFPTLGDVFVTSAVGKSLYNGFTAGVRKRLSKRYQFEANYVLSKDRDDDSNERDPFTDRSFNIFNLSLDYALSDRDIRHKFNFFTYVELPQQFLFIKVEVVDRLSVRSGRSGRIRLLLIHPRISEAIGDRESAAFAVCGRAPVNESTLWAFDTGHVDFLFRRFLV